MIFRGASAVQKLKYPSAALITSHVGGADVCRVCQHISQEGFIFEMSLALLEPIFKKKSLQLNSQKFPLNFFLENRFCCTFQPGSSKEKYVDPRPDSWEVGSVCV